MRALFVAAAVLLSATVRAERRYEPSVSVMLGLSQWLLFEGGNVAAQVKRGRWVFEYSHGQGLNLSRVAALGLSGDERDAGVRLELPFTTGGGGRGLFLQPSLRWWPTVASTLDEDRALMASAAGGMVRHQAHDLIPFVNVSLGWQF